MTGLSDTRLRRIPSRDQRERYDTPGAFRYRSLWSRLGVRRGLFPFNPAPPSRDSNGAVVLHRQKWQVCDLPWRLSS